MLANALWYQTESMHFIVWPKKIKIKFDTERYTEINKNVIEWKNLNVVCVQHRHIFALLLEPQISINFCFSIQILFDYLMFFFFHFQCTQTALQSPTNSRLFCSVFVPPPNWYIELKRSTFPSIIVCQSIIWRVIVSDWTLQLTRVIWIGNTQQWWRARRHFSRLSMIFIQSVGAILKFTSTFILITYKLQYATWHKMLPFSLSPY